jgi:peptide/nickel transport system permease protein
MMFVIVFGASFLAYNLQAFSSNPLSVFTESTEINKDYLIASMIRELQLDVPAPIRYFSWLRGIVAGLWGNFDMGLTRSNIPVTEVLAQAIPVTIKLVITATFLAIVLGVSRINYSHSSIQSFRLRNDLCILSSILASNLLGRGFIEGVHGDSIQ